MPEYGNTLTLDIIKAERTLENAVKFETVARKSKTVLQSMCKVRNIAFEDRDIRDTLAKRLLSWVSEYISARRCSGYSNAHKTA